MNDQELKESIKQDMERKNLHGEDIMFLFMQYYYEGKVQGLKDGLEIFTKK